MLARNLYLLILFLVLPLYAPSGYVGLGDAKVRLYVVFSVLFCAWFLIRGLISRIPHLHRKPLQTASRQKNRSDSEDTDADCMSEAGTLHLRLWRLFILLLIASLLLSSLLSGSFADAWSGADGWMMGFLVQALSLFFAFFFSFPVSGDGEHARKFGTYCLYAGAGITIFLGIANRFRFYPFSYMGIDYTYLSTLGNIDWFCGYLSVVVPILMGDLYLARLDRQSGRKVYVKELLLVMSFLILILSGTESCYLILGICFVSLAIVSVQNQAGLPAFLEQLAAFCLLPVLLHICLITRRPELDRYLYENTQGISWRLIHNWYGVALLAAAVSLLLWRSRMEYQNSFLWKSPIRRSLIRNATSRHAAPVKKQKDVTCVGHLRCFELLCLAGAVLLLLVQVLLPGLYSDRFGSSRGLIWSTCSEIYRGLPLSQKLFGIGPDCLYSYLLSHPEYRSFFLNRFGMDIMNAHSILLNRLLTTGLVGMVLYLVIIVLSLRIWNRKLRSLPYIMMLLCYLAVGTVLFDQITCLPLMLILMGIGIRQE